MKIIVLVKEVPDTYGDRVLNRETGLAERSAGDVVLDEIGERALELAITYADGNEDAEVVALTMGPDSAAASIRKALAIGAGSAIHIADDRLRGADLSLTARVIATALQRFGFDLVIAGNSSTDGTGGVMPAMLAELLGVADVTALTSVEISPEAVRGTRATDDGVATVSATLPAVISITDALPDARFPNFKSIMAAKKKPVETVSLTTLGIDPEDPGHAWSIMTAITEKPPREAGVKIVDDGEAGLKLAEFLIQNRLV